MKLTTPLTQKSKMANYKLTNKNKNLNWKLIEDINWGYLIKQFPQRPYDYVGEFCTENYTLRETILLQNFVVEKRKELQKALKDKIKDIGDDSFWDLCSHIVGLGESVYNLCLKYPEIARILVDDKVENFEYGFTKAVYDLQENNVE